jgi:hypothetical protein
MAVKGRSQLNLIGLKHEQFPLLSAREPVPHRSSTRYPTRGQASIRGPAAVRTFPPVEARPAALPSSRMPKRPPIKAAAKALRASKPSRPVLSATTPQTAIYLPHEPLVQSPAPFRNPAAPLSATANVPSPARAPSFRHPCRGRPQWRQRARWIGSPTAGHACASTFYLRITGSYARV